MKHTPNLGFTPTFSVRSRWIVRTSGAVLLAFAFTFCGCLSRPPLNHQTFAFEIPELSATNTALGDRVLGIKSLKIEPPFDERSFVYRTGKFSYERNPYAGFLGLPAEELLAPVSGILRRDGCFNDVVEVGSAVKPDALVEITINQLYGDIRKPGSPFAVLAMQVMFLDATNWLPGKVIFQRNYFREVPITSTAPASLMEGWNQALIEIFAEVASDFRRQGTEEQRQENHGGN
jgi:cholesterol transport system auxiliary component